MKSESEEEEQIEPGSKDEEMLDDGEESEDE